MPFVAVGALKLVLAAIPAFLILSGALAVFRQRPGSAAVLQLAGPACLIVVVATHIGEVFHIAAWMGWGRKSSPGHDLDLSSAVMASTMFPRGYLLDGLRARRGNRPPFLRRKDAADLLG